MTPEADLKDLEELHHEHLVGTYDAAVLTPETEGRGSRYVDETEKPSPTQRLLGTGFAAGAAIDVLSRPPGSWSAGCESGWGWRPHRAP